MRLTDDIVRAMHRAILEGYQSVADFAGNANVSANTISKYLRKENMNIQEETWQKIYPLIRNHMPNAKAGKTKNQIELTADEKILIDAFSSLPRDVRDQKLIEIIELAKKYYEKSSGGKK